MNVLREGFACFVFLGAFACWAVAMASMLLAGASRRAGAPRPALLEGGFDIMYRPSLLTPEGRRHRRRCFLAMAGFLLCFGLAVLGGLLGFFPRR